MADAGIGAPMDEARSTGFANNSAPLELRLTDPDAPPKHPSDPNYHARADGEVRIQQEGAQPALDLLLGCE